MSTLAASRLSPAQVALLPNHDPMVGRAVGQIFKAQAFNDKPEKVTLNGTLDGTDRVHLTYARQADGSVSVDGVVGALEVHEKITPAVVDSEGGSFFGVSGNVLQDRRAVVTGTIGGEKEEIVLAANRDSTEVHMTGELMDQGRSTMRWGFKVGMTPAFGGDMVTPNMTPSSLPAPSNPLQIKDSYYVQGQVGDVRVSRFVEWNTTTWSVSNTSREGWGWTEFFQHDSGKMGQAAAGKTEGLTFEATPFAVEHNVVTASGFMELEKASGSREQIPFSSRYEQIRAKMAVKVDEQIGAHKLSFSIFPEGDLNLAPEGPQFLVSLPEGVEVKQSTLRR